MSRPAGQCHGPLPAGIASFRKLLRPEITRPNGGTRRVVTVILLGLAGLGCGDSSSPPNTEVHILSPQAGADVSGTVHVEVSTVDVSELTYDVDNEVIGTRSADPFSFTWNSLNTPNGNYELSVVARGPRNSSKDTIPITVNNLGEIVVLLTPTTAQVALGETLAFAAQVLGTGSNELVWTVVSGDEYGTISRDGLYQAPGVMPRPPKARVLATLKDGFGPSGEAEIVLMAPPIRP